LLERERFADWLRPRVRAPEPDELERPRLAEERLPLLDRLADDRAALAALRERVPEDFSPPLLEAFEDGLPRDADPFARADDVFLALAFELGDALLRVPDRCVAVAMRHLPQLRVLSCFKEKSWTFRHYPRCAG
jgi:hypothetical protein